MSQLPEIPPADLDPIETAPHAELQALQLERMKWSLHHAYTNVPHYRRAFEAIDSDPAHILVVAQAGEDVAATMQLSFFPGLARRGALRAQIEAVHVHHAYRGRGLGGAMFAWAIGEAKRRGCALVQLTSDKSRPDAHRFYHRLGFIASHEGLKLAL